MRKPKRLELLLLAVDPAYQKKGVNAILLEEMIRTCHEKGIEIVDLNPQLTTNIAIHSQWRHFETRRHKARTAYFKQLQHSPVSRQSLQPLLPADCAPEKRTDMAGLNN